MVYLIDIINVIQILIKSMKLTIWGKPEAEVFDEISNY